MWSSNPLSFGSLEEVGVRLGPDVLSGVLVDVIVGLHELEIGEGEERGAVGIIHLDRVPEAINLIGEHVIVVIVFGDAMLVDGLSYLFLQRGDNLDQCLNPGIISYQVHFLQQGQALFKLDLHHSIPWDEVLVGCGVIGGSEGTSDESTLGCWGSPGMGETVCGLGSSSPKSIWSIPFSILFLV